MNTGKHSSNCPKCAICPCRCCLAKRERSLSNQNSVKPLNNNIEHRCLLILVRHGLSQDEIDKRYSGWNDCELSAIGKEQMQRTGSFFSLSGKYGNSNDFNCRKKST